MVNENSSGWVAKGTERGLDLKWLEQDKENIYNGLERLGLPTPKRYIFDGSDIDSFYVDEVFRGARSSKEHNFFVRLIPVLGGDRPYRVCVSSVEQLRDFCSAYDMRRYTVGLSRYGDLTHTGSVIATDIRAGVSGECVVEVASCGGPDFFHGKVTPTHAKISIGPRTVKFSEEDLPKNLKKDELKFALEAREIRRSLALKALRMIGGPRHPFPGYYEFSVWDDQIFFRNYQPPSSVYGSLWLPLPEVRESNKRLNGD